MSAGVWRGVYITTVLDTYAIAAIIAEYKKSVDIIEETELRDFQLLSTIEDEFKKLTDRLKDIVQDSEKGRCPNKQGADSCGLMVQTYTNCMTCEEEKVVCAGGPPQNQEFFEICSCLCTQHRCFDIKTGHSCTPCKEFVSYLKETINCGELNVKVTEGEDAILDCNTDWYAKLEDGYKNQFKEKNNPKPVITNYPYMEISDIQIADAGLYTCTTIQNSGMPIRKVTYNVEVMKRSRALKKAFKPEPSTLPAVSDVKLLELPLYNDLRDIKAISLAAATTFFVFCCICGYIFYKATKKTKDPVEKEPV